MLKRRKEIWLDSNSIYKSKKKSKLDDLIKKNLTLNSTMSWVKDELSFLFLCSATADTVIRWARS